jgi:hypothetical protein
VEKAETLLVDGVNYFQVVLTLPKELSSLALGNRRVIYDLLFTASWRALKATVEQEQRFEMAALMVLHTWNQKLDAHGHVHALVPGGGPSLDRPGRWRRTRRRGRDNPLYLVDADQLRRCYRDAFLDGLRKLHDRGGLKLEGDFASLKDPDRWEAFLKKLESTQWVAYIEPPPDVDCRPQDVVRYLGRYLTGGPISDRRLIRTDKEAVYFWARQGTQVGGSRECVPVRLTLPEFVRRWSLHILPKGYVKTRRFGGWSNHHCERDLSHCRKLIGTKKETKVCDPIEPQGRCCCPQCGEAMTLRAEQTQPSWRELSENGLWPWWYARWG